MPVDVRPLFRPLLGELLGVLESLTPDQWQRPAVGSWRVRDVAAHLLDGDLRRLSLQRDGLRPQPAPGGAGTFTELTAFLNELNASWVAAAERIGTPLLVDLLKLTGRQLADFFEPLDLSQPAFFPVAWSGEHANEMWLDLGREYTERWHHQQQIREAAGAPLLVEARWLAPALRVAVHAVPRAYAASVPSAPLQVGLEIAGAGGGVWTLGFADGAWSIAERAPVDATTHLSLDSDAAWRLLHKRLPVEQARARLRVEGDPAWAEPLLRALAVMA